MSRQRREEQLIQLLGTSQFAILLFGPFIWFFVGLLVTFQLIPGVSPDYTTRNQDLAAYVFTLIVQQAFLVPGLRLLDIPVLLKAGFEILLCRPRSAALPAARRHFGYVEQYAIFINTLLLLELGDAPGCAIALLVFGMMYLTDRYSILYVATRPTTIDTHQKLLRFVYRFVWSIAIAFLVIANLGVGAFQTEFILSLSLTSAGCIVVFAALIIFLVVRYAPSHVFCCLVCCPTRRSAC